MAITEESRLVWLKALRKLGDATATPVETFPGIVIVSSYFAMRNAAIAVLLATDGKAPSGDSAIVTSFGVAVGKAGYLHGEAFNRAFDLRNVEDYDAVASPTPKEAAASRSDAEALLRYCAERFGFVIEPPGENAAR